MKHKSLLLLSSFLLLTSCGDNTSNSDSTSPYFVETTPGDSQSDESTTSSKVVTPFIEDFYQDIEFGSYVADNGVSKQTFYGEKGILVENEEESYGFVKVEEQGIFEFHVKEDGDYEVHGMLSPNSELPLFRFAYCFSQILDLDSDLFSFVQEKGFYHLEADTYAKNVFSYLGLLTDVDNIKEANLYQNSNGYLFESVYEDDSTVYITITDIGKTKNKKMDTFASTKKEKQTEWNDYQKKAISYYGFWDIPFFSSYTLGLQLYFQTITLNGLPLTACLCYDYLSSKDSEASIASELENRFGYQEHSSSKQGGVYVYSKPYNADMDLFVSFRFVDVTELSADDAIAYPYGYMQVSYSYAPSEKDFTSDELDTQLLSLNYPAMGLDDSKLDRIYEISYKESQNEAMMTSPDFIEMLKEKGLEPGPVFGEYFSLYLVSEEEDYLCSTLDTFISNLKQLGFAIRIGFEDYDSLPIKQMPNGIGFDLFDGDGYPLVSFDFYTKSLDTGKYEGSMEIVLTQYTELAQKVFFDKP